MDSKEKVLVMISARMDQLRAHAKDGLRLLVREGGLTSIFLHLNFLGILAEKDSTQELPGDVVNVLKHLAHIATVDLLIENNGEFLSELFSMTGDGPSKEE